VNHSHPFTTVEKWESCQSRWGPPAESPSPETCLMASGRNLLWTG